MTHDEPDRVAGDTGARSPFETIDTTSDTVSGPERASTSSFSLRSLFVFFTVCAVLAQFLALVIHASSSQSRGPASILESGAIVVMSIVVMPPLAMIIGALIYGRWSGIVFSGMVAVPIGALIGALAYLPPEWVVAQIAIALGASLLLIVIGLIFLRRPPSDLAS